MLQIISFSWYFYNILYQLFYGLHPQFTKNVHFTYNRKIFVQTNGLAMGSPIGPVLAVIFMTELEKTLLLPDIYICYIIFWRRYVDDTISCVKSGSIKHPLRVLNSFDKNI